MEKTIENERPNVVKGTIGKKIVKVKAVKPSSGIGGEPFKKKPFSKVNGKPHFNKNKGGKKSFNKKAGNKNTPKKKDKHAPAIYLSVSGHSIIGEYGWKINHPKNNTFVGYGQIITSNDYTKCKPCYIYAPRQYVNTKTTPKHSYSMLFRAKTDMRALFAKITRLQKAESDESNPIKVELILYKVVKNGGSKSAVKVAAAAPVTVYEHEFNGQIDKFVGIATEAVKLRPTENKLIVEHIDLFGLALHKCFDDKTSYMYYKNAGKIRNFTE